jgi:two-component system nitrogen regulation response regulator NtrX
MDEQAISAFISYSWPGNVSELINVIERFVIMVQDDVIDSSHLYLLVEPRESQVSTKIREVRSFAEARNQFDREYIHSVLIRNNWDIEKAASDLKLSPAQLNSKIKNLHIHFLG